MSWDKLPPAVQIEIFQELLITFLLIALDILGLIIIIILYLRLKEKRRLKND